MTGFAAQAVAARTDRATAPGLIVHEWVERWGGAERVLDAMMDAFPDAGVRVLWNDTPVFDGREVSESWIARTPTAKQQGARAAGDASHLAHARLGAHPIGCWSARTCSPTTSRHDAETRKLVYAHTPARYIWEPERDHRGDLGDGRAWRAQR